MEFALRMIGGHEQNLPLVLPDAPVISGGSLTTSRHIVTYRVSMSALAIWHQLTRSKKTVTTLRN
jgi:hypothetical protein